MPLNMRHMNMMGREISEKKTKNVFIYFQRVLKYIQSAWPCDLEHTCNQIGGISTVDLSLINAAAIAF